MPRRYTDEEVEARMVPEIARVIYPVLIPVEQQDCRIQAFNDVKMRALALELWRSFTGRGQPAPEWQPISSAPKDGTLILTYVPSGHYRGVQINSWETEFRKSGEWWNTASTDPPTHWRPLPAPPEQEPPR